MWSQDVRYAFRSLLRAPGFTAVALITLALGIGGTTAIFSVVDGILLRPLPYPEPATIVRVSPSSESSESDEAFSPADYLDYRSQSRSFAAIAAYRQTPIDLTGRGEPVRLTGCETTAAFFDVFALGALEGRSYSERIDGAGGPRLAVISERFWEEQFGRARDVVGGTLRLDGVPFTVVGVMPRTFVHPIPADVWMLAAREVPAIPVKIEGDLLVQRDIQYFNAVARLGQGVTLDQARADLRTIGHRLAADHPDTNQGESATATPLQEALVADTRTAVLVLFGAVGFVLLIACANVASLLLARGTGRRREFAVRSALGASRRRLATQLLVESLVLATIGGVLGLLVAYWGIDALLAIAPSSIPRIAEIVLDRRVALFAIGASALVGVLFGLIPALTHSRAEIVDALKDGGRTGTSRTGARSVLVVAEIALSLMLLIGAGLMLASFSRLRSVDPGFVLDNLVIASLPLPQARYDGPQQRAFYQALLERLRGAGDDAGRTRVALVFPPPFSGSNAAGSYEVEGRTPRLRTERHVAQISAVSPGYFQTMGIPLLNGRDISFDDGAESPAVIVINRTLADLEWPNDNPIGKRVNMGDAPSDPDSWLTVVGVVGNSKRESLDAPVTPALYLPFTQFTLPLMSVVMRTPGGEAGAANLVKAAVRSIDPELPVAQVRTIERVIERATGQPRFRATLVGAFAVVALLLAAVGLYGLISFTVAQRVPEIGVRLALGASPGQVARLIVGQGLKLSLLGVAIGLAGALAVTRLIAGLLFSVSATEPVVYASLALFLLTIAALACYLPARRAMHVDPMTALRAE